MPTKEAQIKILVRNGVPVETAVAIAEESEERGGWPVPVGQTRTRSFVGSRSVQEIRRWWYQNTAVPVRFKRILDARTVR